MLNHLRVIPALLLVSRATAASSARLTASQCAPSSLFTPRLSAFSSCCPTNMSTQETTHSTIVEDNSTDMSQKLLPAASDATSAELAEAQRTQATVLEVGGAKVLLDKFGPVVINVDGSISRIANWLELSEHEQKTTLRRIGKRNEERRQALLDKALAKGTTTE
ncbi:hypothetical protein BKA62DRAFT_392468 [Auriculariales sp. MPI-PUGE-AT-0066]|nr:hypothetical protein BKA62DRAFT_392468 [Auriculariales sp. MPI-PUGE-AT-0066]